MGYHCWLCGKNSNSKKQWQQHIQSEKHKEKVFTSDSDSSCWSYRFPMGEFRLCERYCCLVSLLCCCCRDRATGPGPPSSLLLLLLHPLLLLSQSPQGLLLGGGVGRADRFG